MESKGRSTAKREENNNVHCSLLPADSAFFIFSININTC
jgi:hypothetical protein